MALGVAFEPPNALCLVNQHTLYMAICIFYQAFRTQISQRATNLIDCQVFFLYFS